MKCSHGSTTGRLNADELFYLESRGLLRGGRAGDARGRVFRGPSHPRTEKFRDDALAAIKGRLRAAA